MEARIVPGISEKALTRASITKFLHLKRTKKNGKPSVLPNQKLVLVEQAVLLRFDNEVRDFCPTSSYRLKSLQVGRGAPLHYLWRRGTSNLDEALKVATSACRVNKDD